MRLRAALLAVIVLLTTSAAATPPTTLRIMTIGDSLNTGLGSEDGCGYRTKVNDLMLTAGVGGTPVAVTWTGELNGSNANDCKLRYGHFGATVQDLKNNITGWLNTDQPDVVLVQIGTRNAMGEGAGLTGFQLDYQWVIQYVFNWSTSVKVVVSYVPYSVATWAPNEVTVNTLIYSAVQAFLPYYNGRLYLINASKLPCTLLGDRVHPFDYRPIGAWYYEALAALYGFTPLPLNSYFFGDQPRPGYERAATVCAT